MVKGGVPRIVLQIVENSSNAKLSKEAIELIKNIALSNNENLEMVVNQSKIII
jgi:hypothetical protein